MNFCSFKLAKPLHNTYQELLTIPKIKNSVRKTVVNPKLISVVTYKSRCNPK